MTARRSAFRLDGAAADVQTELAVAGVAQPLLAGLDAVERLVDLLRLVGPAGQAARESI